MLRRMGRDGASHLHAKSVGLGARGQRYVLIAAAIGTERTATP